MSRFVLLHHECPPSFGKPSHWDFMLEQAGALLTWSMLELPAAWQGGWETSGQAPSIPATRLPDHRLAYLDYEGPVSGDRGEVHRHDAGEYLLIEQTDGLCRVELCGELARGPAILQRMADDQWRLAVGAAAGLSG